MIENTCPFCTLPRERIVSSCTSVEANVGNAFVLEGNLRNSLDLTPTEFRAVLSPDE